MAELSSNWKRLQAKLRAAPTSSSRKRSAEDDAAPALKIQKLGSDCMKSRTKRPYSKSVSPSKMGGVHSSKVEIAPKLGSTPSLEIWSPDNGMSSEGLAEAYGLGLQANSMLIASEKDRVNHGLTSGLHVGKYVALDCEMVGVGPGGHESSLARISLVDFHGQQIYDSYVKQKERVTDWRTAVSGVSVKEMRFARGFEEVQQTISDIIQGRILIGHDIKHDLEALKLNHPPRDIRDTAKHHAFKRYGNGRKPALRTLAHELLGVDIQTGAHSSTEDARVTMLIFRKDKSGFDVDHANRYRPTSVPQNTGRPSKRKGKRE